MGTAPADARVPGLVFSDTALILTGEVPPNGSMLLQVFRLFQSKAEVANSIEQFGPPCRIIKHGVHRSA
jgi:hypothetical protein